MLFAFYVPNANSAIQFLIAIPGKTELDAGKERKKNPGRENSEPGFEEVPVSKPSDGMNLR